jgi:hypothetical protein
VKGPGPTHQLFIELANVKGAIPNGSEAVTSKKVPWHQTPSTQRCEVLDPAHHLVEGAGIHAGRGRAGREVAHFELEPGEPGIDPRCQTASRRLPHPFRELCIASIARRSSLVPQMQYRFSLSLSLRFTWLMTNSTRCNLSRNERDMGALCPHLCSKWALSTFAALKPL